MKYKIARAAIAASLTLGTLGAAGIASADSPATIGTPGTPNCQGQTIAYINQYAKQNLDVAGLGNIGRFVGASVKDIHAAVDAYCASSPL